ncbi:unnamed protein product [Peniophora sp. CBMAI 1063]|nr:unnamed protein product [Peniophora sp. CBMAI 1063]
MNTPSHSAPTISLSLHDAVQADASKLYAKAWGLQWSRQTRTSIAPIPSNNGVTDAHAQLGQEGTQKQETCEYEYECLIDLINLPKTFRPTSGSDVLVVLHEYDLLLDFLSNGYLRDERAMAVTGQPGCGKSTFLLYLLLHRLSLKRPTALHLPSTPHHYIIFDALGATAYPLTSSPTQSPSRLHQCTALCDSDEIVKQPCDWFLLYAARVLQMARPGTDRWSGWLKQLMGNVVVLGGPSDREIGAIMKERGYDPLPSFAHIHKWGPSTRRILDLVDVHPARTVEDVERILTRRAEHAAIDICATPVAHSAILRGSTTTEILDSLHFDLKENVHYFDLVFMRPVREALSSGIVEWEQFELIIPTGYLRDVFERERVRRVRELVGGVEA